MTTEKTASFGFEDIPAAEKAGRVAGVFSSVATRYDLMNDLMSAGVHRLWKDAFTAKLDPRRGEAVLDVGGGTGDIAFRILKAAAARVTVLDINEDMLAAGRARPEAGADGLSWLCADAEALPFPGGSFDAYSIAFCIRNVTRIEAALSEARRVLKRGGRFFCLEFSKVNVPVLDAAYDFWSFNVLPALGARVAGDAESYRYLAESIRRFPAQQDFAAMIEAAGFARVSVTNLSGGIAAIHSGWVL